MFNSCLKNKCFFFLYQICCHVNDCHKEELVNCSNLQSILFKADVSIDKGVLLNIGQ